MSGSAVAVVGQAIPALPAQETLGTTVAHTARGTTQDALKLDSEGGVVIEFSSAAGGLSYRDTDAEITVGNGYTVGSAFYAAWLPSPRQGMNFVGGVHSFKTYECYISLWNGQSDGAGTVIAVDGASEGFFGQLPSTVAVRSPMGVLDGDALNSITGGEILCMSPPAGPAGTDVDFYFHNANLAQGAAAAGTQAIDSGGWTVGERRGFGSMSINLYLYAVAGSGGAGTMTGGAFLVRLFTLTVTV